MQSVKLQTLRDLCGKTVTNFNWRRKLDQRNLLSYWWRLNRRPILRGGTYLWAVLWDAYAKL